MTNTSQIQQNWLENPSSLSCNLPDWGLIVIEGVDAASFLQNQLTNSVLGLTQTLPGQIAQGSSGARLVGYCNPKGRLMASAWIGVFRSAQDSEDRFALFLSKDIAVSTAKRLSMYVLRSKVKVTDLSSIWSISGLYCSNQQMAQIKPDPDTLNLRLPDVVVNGLTITRLLRASPFPDSSAGDGLNERLMVWNELEVLSAIPRIVQATQEQFVPQMVNFESVGGVDFKKGCYPGQEIVARSQYRGAIKRRLQLAYVIDSECPNVIKPGIELFHSGDPGQPAGMVVLSAQRPGDPGRIDAQVECKLESLDTGKIHLGSSEGPVLKIETLPYPLLEI